jgi:hypothetical protein
MNLTRTKTIEQSIADTEEPEHQLRKELGPVQLTVFGVGVIIGTGIFVLTGEAAGEKAGPAVALSFVFSRHRMRAGCVVTRSSQAPCRSRARRTRSPTRAWASWSPGSSVGT